MFKTVSRSGTVLPAVSLTPGHLSLRSPQAQPLGLQAKGFSRCERHREICFYQWVYMLGVVTGKELPETLSSNARGPPDLALALEEAQDLGL